MALGGFFFWDGNCNEEREGDLIPHLNENSMLALSMSVGPEGICAT